MCSRNETNCLYFKPIIAFFSDDPIFHPNLDPSVFCPNSVCPLFGAYLYFSSSYQFLVLYVLPKSYIFRMSKLKNFVKTLSVSITFRISCVCLLFRIVNHHIQHSSMQRHRTVIRPFRFPRINRRNLKIEVKYFA